MYRTEQSGWSRLGGWGERHADWWLRDGWRFFVPYLALFVVGRWAGWPTEPLKAAYQVLHVYFLSLLGLLTLRRLPGVRSSTLLFWQLLVLLFVLPGVYLEFPADPWEHVRRLFSWARTATVAHEPGLPRMAYFWGYSVLSDVAVDQRRLALGLYSAFWQLLVAFQVYQFALRLGFGRAWAKVQVLGTVGFFGLSVFGFYRYYALSSTPLAFVAYLRALIVIMDVLDGRRRQAWWLIALVPLMLYNHRQELLLLVVSAVALLVAWLAQSRAWRRRLAWSIPTLAVLGVGFGWLVVRYAQSLPFERWNPPKRFIASWGGFRIWDWSESMPYREAIGVLGLVSIVLALGALILGRDRRVAWLTVMPFVALTFPPFVFLFVVGYHHPSLVSSYRILFAMPASFMVVAVLRRWLIGARRRWPRPGGRRWLPLVAAALLFVPASHSAFPWCGKLWFQVHRPDTTLALEWHDATYAWFLRDFDLDPRDFVVADIGALERPEIVDQLQGRCVVISDGATGFGLAAHAGMAALTDRVRLSSLGRVTYGDFLRPEICGLLLPDPERQLSAPLSPVAERTGHWAPDLVQQELSRLIDIPELTNFLSREGWQDRPVPNHYRLWMRDDPCLVGSDPSILACDDFESGTVFGWTNIARE